MIHTCFAQLEAGSRLRSRAGALVVLAAMLAVSAGFATASASATVGVPVYYGGSPVPYGESNHELTRGNDGNVWFAEELGIGKATTSGAISHAVTLTAAPIALAPGRLATEPIWFVKGDGSVHQITSTGGTANAGAVAPASDIARGEGVMWVTHPKKNKVGYIAESGGLTFEIPCPLAAEAVEITVAGGFAYATEAAPVGSEHTEIAKISLTGTFPHTTCHVSETPVETHYNIHEGRYELPTDITNGPEGKAWFLTTTNLGSTIGSIDSSGSVQYFKLPIGISATTLAYGADGRLWWNDVPLSYFGSMDKTGTIKEYYVGGEFLPTVFAPGPDGAMWFIDEHKGIGKFPVE